MVGTLALAAPALIQGGASLINYFKNKNALKKMPKRPGFEGSSYADMLKRRSTEGMYSPETMNTMMRDVGQGVSERTEMGKSGYARRLLNQGIGGSMAGQRGLNEFETSKSTQLTDAERRLKMANEASKLGAGEQYEQMKYGDQIQQYMDDLNRRQAKMENENQFVSGLAGAATTGIGAYTQALGGQNRTIADVFGKEEGNIPADLMGYSKNMRYAELLQYLKSKGLSEEEMMNQLLR